MRLPMALGRRGTVALHHYVVEAHLHLHWYNEHNVAIQNRLHFLPEIRRLMDF
jgi:hypothetical protein